jgi:propionyl-CoA carboxylase alpha chain
MQRVLVANRGEIARRVFRTCRRLGVGTVAVYSEADAEALFVREADRSVAIGGPAPADSYLRGDAVIEAALSAGADAVHPGYGFLAENAGFARAVAEAGLTWIGPSPEAIEAMGSKVEARDRMEQAGVPVLPGRRLDGEAGDALAAVAEAVGFPLLVKASAGGGGKGMRLVEEAGDLEGGVEGARREAAGAFGDDTVFLERFAPRSRHVEIQIMGDAHGTVAALGERDCSVQRRHQKVIEESPSPAVDEGLRQAMSAAAVAAGEALGYVGAGTVEFLLTEDGEFFFLEVNTRLQVEHPVTELVTGLDLVALQLAVAEGEPLPAAALHPALTGHAVEARLYAEDPANDFLPVTGTLSRFSIVGDVRVDTGVEDGAQISPHYDPMVAKVVAHGPTRAAAARLLADALARAELHGTTTNRDFLVRVLRDPEFLAGDADTSYLERRDVAELSRPLLAGEQEALAAAAAAMALQARNRRDAGVLAAMPSGWRNVPAAPHRISFAVGERELAVDYAFDRADRLATLVVDGEPVDAPALHACTPEVVDLEAHGHRRRYEVHAEQSGAVHVNTDSGQVSLTEIPRYPTGDEEAAAGSLTSPMPGSVWKVLAAAGDQVEKGQPLLVIEAMKMEHEIVAPVAGPLEEMRVAEGDQVDAGAILAVIGEADG